MDRAQRFRILAEAAADDRETGLPARARLNEGPVGIRPVRLPGGGSTTLMRVMQTNACSLSCGYCPTFCGGRVKRTALSPEEVARTFMESHRSGVAQGLFLTSGVPGRAPRAVDRMLAAVEILRRREGFAGYVHIKMLPGAEREQVIAATRLATRVSVNLEGPSDAVVRGLAREKDYSGDLLPTLMLAGRLSREARLEGRPGIAAAGTTTQFVVGAQGERDREILGVVGSLERQGLPWLARQIGIRLLNAVNIAGAHVEFLYVSPDQRVMYDFRARDLRSAEPEVITGTNQPEAPITWTVTAALALKSWLGSNRKFLGPTGAPDAESWRLDLEAEVLDQVPEVAVHRTSAELRRAYARRGNFVLNLEDGVERDRRARARGRGSDGLGQIAA